MNDAPWTRVWLSFPKRVSGRWRWLCWVEERPVFSGCSLYGEVNYEYRAVPGVNTYRHRFVSRCPVNGARIEYLLTIRTDRVIPVENILAAIPVEGLHEAIADTLAKLGGHQTLIAEHHGVTIETERQC